LALGPDVGAGTRIDELGGYANALCGLAITSRKHVLATD